MASSSDAPPRRLLLFLTAVAVATLMVVGVLLFRTRSTVVEIEAEVDRFELILVPPAQRAGEREKIDFLAPSLNTTRLDLQGAGSVEAFLDGRGRSTLRPGLEDVVRIAAGEPFQPVLSVFGRTRVSIEAAGRDRAGHRKLRIGLIPEETGAGAWSGTVPASFGLDLEVPSASGETTRAQVTPMSPDLVLAGRRTEGVAGLTLPGDDAPATVLRLIDPLTGGVAEQRLPFATSEARALAWGDRLALLEPAAARPDPLLRPGLKAERPRFFRTERFDQESFITGGKVRFPGGEKGELALEPRVLLSVRAREPFTLRSVAVRDGRLAVLLWGRATSLKLGPTPELLNEELPSLFVWLYTHKLSTFVYSTLVTVLGVCWAAVKTFGLFKNPS